jgi:iron complex outermembrane recepter protein
MSKRISRTSEANQSPSAIWPGKAILALCIGTALQSTVWAQSEASDPEATTKEQADESVEDLDALVVIGIRDSLEKAQNIKREADTHVDAISASDISALPDVSVLEALQRVPGISIERFAAKDDPDHFSTEGSGITLRGLPNTRSEFNGRDTFSANSGRGLSFQDVSPELLGRVEVFKNQTADMIEGGISGTVNLVTRKPLDSSERLTSFSVQSNYGDLEGKTTPSGSALFANSWDIDAGRVGILASVAYSDLDFRSDGAQFGPHVQTSANSGRYAPINGGIRTTSTNRKRTGGSVAFEFLNTEGTFGALAEYLRSDSSTTWIERAFFSDDGAGRLPSDAVFNGPLFSSGTLTGLGTAFGPQTRNQDTNVLVDDLNVKLEFNPSDRLSITTDLQYIKSSTDAVDLSVFGGMIGGPNVTLANGGPSPRVSFSAPTGSAQSNAQYFADPNNYFWRAAMDHVEDSDGDELAARVDLDFQLESDFFRSVEAGLRFSERDQTTRWSNYNWGNLSESWAGGFARFSGTPSGNGYTNNQASPFSFGDFHTGGVGGLPGGIGIFANPSLVTSYANFRRNFDVPGVNRSSLSGRAGAIGSYIPAEINGTNEQNTAAYVRVNFEADSERRFGGNFGLRFIKQDTRVAGGTVFTAPNNLQPTVLATLPPGGREFVNGFSSNGKTSSSFDSILPSLNLKYELTPDLLLRLGLSKAVAYPELGNLRFNYNINLQTVNVGNDPVFLRFFQSSGNPFLEPMESNNLDLSLEYYFSDSGYISAAGFYKDIKNFFSNNSVETRVTNPSNGITQTVDIDQPVNIGQASVKGFEMAYQQFFDKLPGVWSGLGMQFNYTFLDTSTIPQQNLRPVQSGGQSDADRASIPFDNLPLQSLSRHQYNLVGLFQNEKWEGRLAYNWRDDYLLTIREVNIGLPTFAKDLGQLDGSIFYRLNSNLQLGLQGSNLLQEEVVTENQVNAQGLRAFRSSFIYDRRYSFVIRGTF